MTRKKSKWILVYYTSHQRFERYKSIIYPFYLNNINEALGYQNDKFI